MENELKPAVVSLMESLFVKCDPKLKSWAYVRREDLRIAMPEVLMQTFIDGLDEIYGIGKSNSSEGRNQYRGIEIIPNYEMSIVFFHKDYPKTKESWMIYKILL